MSGFFDEQEIGIPCPNCGNKTQKSIGWVNNNSQFTCACGSIISINADDLKRGLSEAEASIAKFTDMFKKL